MTNDPKIDGINFAHPAWWRGERHGFAGCVEAVRDILDGKRPVGVCSDEKWEAVRRRLWELVSRQGQPPPPPRPACDHVWGDYRQSGYERCARCGAMRPDDTGGERP